MISLRARGATERFLETNLTTVKELDCPDAAAAGGSCHRRRPRAHENRRRVHPLLCLLTPAMHGCKWTCTRTSTRSGLPRGLCAQNKRRKVRYETATVTSHRGTTTRGLGPTAGGQLVGGPSASRLERSSRRGSHASFDQPQPNHTRTTHQCGTTDQGRGPQARGGGVITAAKQQFNHGWLKQATPDTSTRGYFLPTKHGLEGGVLDTVQNQWPLDPPSLHPPPWMAPPQQEPRRVAPRKRKLPTDKKTDEDSEDSASLDTSDGEAEDTEGEIALTRVTTGPDTWGEHFVAHNAETALKHLVAPGADVAFCKRVAARSSKFRWGAAKVMPQRHTGAQVAEKGGRTSTSSSDSPSESTRL